MPYQRNNSNMIYSQETFQKQPDGVVFYKEGMLNDFPTANYGIFESWRYNFDSGKQVFRAINDDGNLGKLWEKRLVKDIYGNPQWTGWMEIPPAEAYGVQAIAVNDRPLQLPNADGAIKIQITPEIINTYTKKEIYDLIDKKISDNEDKVYTYVPWCIEQRDKTSNSFAGREFLNGRIIADYGKWCTEAEDVLWNTYPNGGNTEQFYLVEPAPRPNKGGGVEVITPGETDNAKYFLWDQRSSPIGNSQATSYAWIPIDAPDMKAFVNYATFNEHQEDKQQHTNEEERTKWNEASERVIKVETDLETKFDETKNRLDVHIENVHINDTDDKPLNSDPSPHVSSNDRRRWNESWVRNTEYQFPTEDATKRYIIKDGKYIPAYEQSGNLDPNQEAKPLTILEKPINTVMVKNNHYSLPDELGNTQCYSYHLFSGLAEIFIEEFVTKNRDISKVVVSLGNVTFAENEIWLETELYQSDNPKYATQKSESLRFTQSEQRKFEWIINPALIRDENNPGEIEYYNNIYLIAKANNKPVHLGDQTVTVYYKEMNTVNIGDPNRELTLNLIGPSGVGQMPLYNGEPLSKLMMGEENKTIDWSNITGDINENKDLIDAIADSQKNKLFIPDNKTHIRYDVYQDTLLPSLLQQIDYKDESNFKVNHGTEYINAAGTISTEDFSDSNVITVVPGLQNDLIIGGIKQKIFDAYRGNGKIPYYCALKIDYVDVSELSATPAYFVCVDNNEHGMFEQSANLQNGKLTIQYPGSSVNTPSGHQLTSEFDKIYLKGAETKLQNVRLEVRWIKYTDVVAEARDHRTNAELYNWTQNAKNYNLNASGAININAEINTTWNPNGEPISGNLNIYTAQDFNTNVSGTLNTDISGDVTTIYQSNEKIDISGSKEEAISGNLLITVKGDSVNKVEADASNTVVGNLTNTIEGLYVNTVKGNEMNIVDGSITTSSKLYIHETAPIIDIKSHKLNLNKLEETETHEYGAYLARENERVAAATWNEEHKDDPDFVAKEIPEELNKVTVYGEELDTRYANREVYLRKISDLEYEDTILDKRINQEVIDRTNTDSDIRKFVVKNREEIEVIINTTDKSIEPRAEAVFEEKITDYYDNTQVYTKGESDDNYYKKLDVYRKDEIDDLQRSELERFDLVINDNDEFVKLLNSPEDLNKPFNSYKRILFKTGNYKYTRPDGALQPSIIDLNGIEYIKGEEPVTIDFIDEADIKPLSYENILLETISMRFGAAKMAVELNSYANETKTYEIKSEETQTITLDKYHTIYKFILFANATITLDNIINGRNYTIYIDHDEKSTSAYNFKFTNHLHNALELNMLGGFKDKTVGTRTVINFTGTSENDYDGMIINEIIPKVEERKVGDIRIKVGKIHGYKYDPTTEQEEARNIERDIILVYNKDKGTNEPLKSFEDPYLTAEERKEKSLFGIYKSGDTVWVKSTFTNGDVIGDSELTGNCTGWTHNYKLKYDWEIVNPNVPSTDTTRYIIARGMISTKDYIFNEQGEKIPNKDIYFIMPDKTALGITNTVNDPEDLILNFYPVPHTVPVILDKRIDQYVAQTKGIFKTILENYNPNGLPTTLGQIHGGYKLYQTYYDTVELDIIMKDDAEHKNGYAIYKLKNNLNLANASENEYYNPHANHWTFNIDKLPLDNKDDRKYLFNENDQKQQAFVITPFCYKKIYDLEGIKLFNESMPIPVEGHPGYNNELLYWPMDDTKYNLIHYELTDLGYLSSPEFENDLIKPDIIGLTYNDTKLVEIDIVRDDINKRALNKHKVKILNYVYNNPNRPSVSFTLYTSSSGTFTPGKQEVIKTMYVDRPLDTMTIIQNFEKYNSLPERTNKEEIDINGRTVLRKSTKQNETYRFDVKFDPEVFTDPTYRNGIWTIDGKTKEQIDNDINKNKLPAVFGDEIILNDPAFVEGGLPWNNSVEVIVQHTGTFSLKFESTYDRTKSAPPKEIKVYVHPEFGIIIPNNNEANKYYTDRSYGFHIQWYSDKTENGGVPINTSEIDNTSGLWSWEGEGNNNRLILNENTGTIKITNDPIPPNINQNGDPVYKEYEVFVMKYDTNDLMFNETTGLESVDILKLVSGRYNIYRNNYTLQFMSKEGTTTEWAVNANISPIITNESTTFHGVKADDLINVRLTFEDGYTASDELVEYLNTLPNIEVLPPPNINNNINNTGIYKFNFTMPYRNEIIYISTKKIN